MDKIKLEPYFENSDKTGGYMMVNFALFRTFDPMAMAVLSNLINKSRYFAQKHPEAQGWFFLTHAQQMKQLGVSEHVIIQSKKKLKKAGFITTKMARTERIVEYYYINHSVIEKTVLDIVKKEKIQARKEQQEALGLPNGIAVEELSGATPQQKGGHNNNKANKNKQKKLNNILRADATEGEYDTTTSSGSIKRTRPPKSQKLKRTIKPKRTTPPKKKVSMAPPANKPPKKEDTSIPYIPLAQKLSDTIRTKKDMKHTPSQIKTWAKEMEKLDKQNNIVIARQRNALDWYDKNIGQPYVPVIESGKSFRAKFFSLEAAIERSEQFQFNKPQVKTPANAYRGKEVNQGLLDFIRSKERVID